MFLRFVIGLILPLLLVTLTTQFSLDRKQRSSTLMITTPTQLLVKTSLAEANQKVIQRGPREELNLELLDCKSNTLKILHFLPLSAAISKGENFRNPLFTE